MIAEIDSKIFELFKNIEQEEAMTVLNRYSPAAKKKILEKLATVPPEDLPLHVLTV
jgi:predicted HAD superfamily phosphohydrolase